MPDATNDLIVEILRSLQQDVRLLKDGQSEIKQELISIRGTMVSMQQDINNIYGILARHEERLDRIERRLELRELAEPQHPFDPNA